MFVLCCVYRFHSCSSRICAKRRFDALGVEVAVPGTDLFAGIVPTSLPFA
jgi:hypothetical protein